MGKEKDGIFTCCMNCDRLFFKKKGEKSWHCDACKEFDKKNQN